MNRWAFAILALLYTSGAMAGSATSLELCGFGDKRTPISTWTPTVDGQLHLSSEPPQGEGLIVYIKFSADGDGSSCIDDEMQSFSIPNDPKDFQQGGLAVNIRGPVSMVDGKCQFAGFYKNESVDGMHQGYIETYFGVLEGAESPTPKRYCLNTPLPK